MTPAKVSLVVTSPGFGSSSVNSGCASVTKEPGERKLSQEEIADKLTKWTKQYPNAKTSVTTTNCGQQTWWFTIQYIIQTQNFSKLEEKIPLFMEAVDNDPTFQCLM
jgi:HAE1 family hydrophobic/amphiphilic exporter-1/multidrug efflux pump